MDIIEANAVARSLGPVVYDMTEAEYVALGQFYVKYGRQGWAELTALADLGIIDNALAKVNLINLVDEIVPTEELTETLVELMSLVIGGNLDSDDLADRIDELLEPWAVIQWLEKHDAALDLVLGSMGIKPLPEIIPVPIRTFVTIGLIALALHNRVGSPGKLLPTQSYLRLTDDPETAFVEGTGRFALTARIRRSVKEEQAEVEEADEVESDEN